MKKLILITAFSLCTTTVYLQTLTLEDCYQMARKNYPLIKQYELIEKAKGYNLAAAAKSYLPQLSISARATWQSDITEFPEEFTTLLNQMHIEGIEFPSQDQYKIVLELYQTVWDGGYTAYQRKLIKAQSETDAQNVEVNLYAVKKQINQLYFGILLLDEQLKQNELLLKELQRNYNRISSLADNGLAGASDIKKIKVEMLQRKQSETEIHTNLDAYRKMLSLLIGQELSNSVQLEKPKSELSVNQVVSRPELKLYDAQIHQLSVQKKGILVKSMPRIGLFAQGAYANPGLNMFQSGFTPYFIGGVSLSWNLSGFYTYNNDSKNINIAKNSVQTQRETFLFQVNQQLAKTNGEIEKYKNLLIEDDEIIQLREEIKQISEKKVENGTLSINEYLQDIVLADMAKQCKSLHEMQLLLSIYQLKTETGE